MLSYNSPPASVAGQSVATAPPPPAAATASATGPAPSSSSSSSSSTSSSSHLHTRPPAVHHIWLVTGPAGCGKSTVAEFLAQSLEVPYIEGDNFHPPGNISKMSNGVPLTDEDRWDWLTALRDEAMRQLLGTAGTGGDVVVTCSALKRKYRDVIRVAGYYDHSLQIHFIYLHAPESVITRRVQARQGHYMSAGMVHSQYSILEPPGTDERDVVGVDASEGVEETKQAALAKLMAVRVASRLS